MAADSAPEESDDVPEESENIPEESNDVALVLVHGIGAQLRGATLVEWAEPITRRLNMIAKGVGGHARVTRSLLGSQGPAEVRIEVHRPDRDVRSILITEARWAEEFVQQSSGPVLWWAVRFSFRAAWRAATHFMRFGNAMKSSARATAATISPTRRVQAVAASLAHAFLAIPLTASILLLLPLVLAAVIMCLGLLTVLSHIPLIRERINPLIQALTSSIGDAATWTSRPVNAAAIRDTVRHGIRQAGRRAREVIVLGHSQGAAASVEAILAPDAGPDLKVDKLITVGGAVLLLRSPRFQSDGDEQHFSPIQAWSAKQDLHWINIWAMWDPVSSGPITTHPKEGKYRWAECYVHSTEKLMHQAAVKRTMTSISRRKHSSPAVVFDGKIRIVQGGDFPLPWNRIEPPRECAGPEEWPVHNRGSLFRDHIKYAANFVQVIDPLAYQLMGEVKPPGGRATRRPESPGDLTSEAGQVLLRLFGWNAATALAHGPRTTDDEMHQNLVRLLGWTKAIALIFAMLAAPHAVEAFSGRPWLATLGEAARTLNEGAGKFFDWLISTGLGHFLELSLAAAAIFLAANVLATGLWAGANHLNAWGCPKTSTDILAHHLPFLCLWFLNYGLITGAVLAAGGYLTLSDAELWLLLPGIYLLPVLSYLPLFGARPVRIPARRRQVDAG